MQSAFRPAFIRLVLASLVMTLVLSAPARLRAQDVASLTGIVTDTTGAVIPDVHVKLLDTKTNTSYETTTNSVGAYTFAKVLPGPGYQLYLSRDGFASQRIANIYLGVDATHTQNAQLQVGQTTQTVEVNGSGSQVSLDTTDTAVSTTLNMSMVHELPLVTRDNPLGLLAFSLGSRSPPAETTTPLAAGVEL